MRITTLVTCVLALSACSGATSYRSTYNAADYAYADEATAHLREAINFADTAAVRDADPAVRRAAAAWARLARAEVRAIDGIIDAAGDPLSAKAATKHVRDHPQPAFPTKADLDRGSTVAGRLLAADREAVRLARPYREQGRQPSLVSVAGWIIEDRAAEMATLRSLGERR